MPDSFATDEAESESRQEGVDRERRALDILNEALALDVDAQTPFLDQHCGGDRELRAEVDSLLAEVTAVQDGFLERPAHGELVGHLEDSDLPTLAGPSGDAPPPQSVQLGPYRVAGVLGKGGMGTVYLGEQEEPVRRRVALKVIYSIHNRQQVRRFAAECQALAYLNHPNVASLYEVGTTKDGRPFVAMELVEGTKITDWCDQKQLGLRQRIELFFGVCAGVRHAHEKGILHRDLKPSNVLVTEVDGRPVAKVIDFGIARAIDEPLLRDSRPLTLDHQIVGSPAYMSPETVLGKPVDTRSDVYALGLLLYQLIAGVLPFDLEKQTLVRILKRLMEGDLELPSHRFAELNADRRQEIAGLRKLRVGSLQRRLRGDLDAIVGRAIDADPEQRFSSPADLASDLEHYLRHRPVTSRPPAVSYVVGRFLRRRLGIVSAVGALIVALAFGVIARTQEAHRANLEARRAQEVSRFLVDLFGLADPERHPDEPVDVRQLLDQGAQRLRHELADQPLDRARLLHTIGEIYTKMGLLEPAEELAVEALELREAGLSADHRDLLTSINQLGVIYRLQERFEEAEPLLRRVLAGREASGADDPLELAQACNNLGNLLWQQGRLEEAADFHQRALALRQKGLEPDDPDLAETLNNLGVLYQDLKRYPEAQRYLQRADEIFAANLGSEHPIRAAALNNLGLVERKLKRWAASEAHFRQALAIWQAAYGESHPRTLTAKVGLARLLSSLGREAESVPLFREVQRLREEAGTQTDRQLRGTLRNLGLALGWLGEFDSAEAALQRSFELYTAAYGEEYIDTVQARSNLAWLMLRRGRFAEAEVEFRQILELSERLFEPDHDRIGSALRYVALALMGQGRDQEAEPLLRRALAIREATRGEDHRRVGSVLLELGELADRGGRAGEARQLLGRAVEIYRQELPPGHRELRRATDALAAVER